MKFKSLLAASAIAVLTGAAPTAYAALYSGSDTFQGVTFTIIQTDANSLTLRIAGTPGGDWATANYLGAFDLKDLGLDFGSVTAVANGPGATNLAGLNQQLSANAKDCQSAGSPPGSICFDIAPDQPLGSSPINLLYTIDFSANLAIVAATGPHLQVAFTATVGGDKVGSLYSLNIPGTNICTTCTPDTTGIDITVPEPGSVALLAVALLGLGLMRRRQES